MTRREEINIAAKNKYPYIKGLPQSSSHQAIFIEGAEWADKTMLDRACEWLKLRISVDVPIETNENGEPLADSWIKAQMERAKAAEELIAEFRQAMKGGADDVR